MAHKYAGILGPLAMLAAFARGMVHSCGAEEVVVAAWICLAAFACIGGAVGALAGWIVEQSVRASLASELSAAEPQNT